MNGFFFELFSHIRDVAEDDEDDEGTGQLRDEPEKLNHFLRQETCQKSKKIYEFSFGKKKPVTC